MFLDELNLRVTDVIMLIGFVIAGAGAYWKVMAELRSVKEGLAHLEKGHEKLSIRNETADKETAALRDTIHQQAVNAAAMSTKLDGIAAMLDKVYNKLDKT
jgi:hypothetical protein